MLRGTQLDKEAAIVPSDSRSFSSDLQLVGMFSSSQKSHKTRDFMSPKCRPVLWSNIVQRQAKGRLKQSSSVVLADLSASLQFSEGIKSWCADLCPKHLGYKCEGKSNLPNMSRTL